MCLYFKDDGEQCSRDDEPFCFQHEDSQQAQIYHVALEAADSGSKSEQSDHDLHHCENCGTAVRRTVSDIEPSDYSPEMVNVSESLVCSCSETIVRTYRMEKEIISGSWYNDS